MRVVALTNASEGDDERFFVEVKLAEFTEDPYVFELT